MGGACVTEEPWPGFRINTYSYVAGMLRPQIIDYLELRRFGFRTLPCSPSEFCPFPDGRSLSMWEDAEATLREIAKFSARDAKVYPRYVEYWERTFDILEPLLLQPPVPLPVLLAQLEGQGIDALLRDLFLLSVEEFLDGWFESDQLKASLAINGLIGEMCGPRTPGTASCWPITMPRSSTESGKLGDSPSAAWDASPNRWPGRQRISGPAFG